MFGLKQFGANVLGLLLRDAGFADEVIHNVAFAAVLAALDLCDQQASFGGVRDMLWRVIEG